MNYKFLKFFDKSGENLNFAFNADLGYWEGTVYFPRVSVDLYENQHIFILEKVLTGSPLSDQFTTPILGQQIAPVLTQWRTRWETSDTKDQIFTYDITEVDSTPYITTLDTVSLSADAVPYSELSPDMQKEVASATAVPLQLNIAFTSLQEDIYERTLIIEDMSFATPKIVARIGFYGETVGEDERFRLVLENFGRSFTQQDALMLRDYDITEALPDWKQINDKRKEMFVAGEDIFPYIGSYKGLINIVRFFGYQDLRIKEYWLNIDKTSENFNKISQYEIEGLLDDSNNPILSNPLRTSKIYRKTSMFGLFYDITVATGEVDQFGTPITKDAFMFSNEEVLIKLFALKEKLKQYYLPLNARIVDIVGEGIYFERYGTRTWTDTINVSSANVGHQVDFVSVPELGYIRDLRKFQVQRFSPGLDLPVEKFTNLINPYTFGQGYPAYAVPGLISSIEAYYAELQHFTFPYNDEKDQYIGDEPGVVGGCPIVLRSNISQFTWDNMDVSWDSMGGVFTTTTTANFIQPASNGDVSVSVGTTSWMSPSAAKVVTVTLAGTTGTANLRVGPLTKPIVFNTNLATTAANFVASWAATYATFGIIVTNLSNTIIFTTPYKGWDFEVGSTTNAGDFLTIISTGSAYVDGVHTGVTFSGGAGTGFLATLIIEGGIVTRVLMTNPGTGYLNGDILIADNSGSPSIGIGGSPDAAIQLTINDLTGTHVVTTAPVSNVVYIAGGGYYQIASITNSVTVVLTNLGYDTNLAPGLTVNSGDTVIGATGTIGSQGLYTWGTIDFSNYYEIQWTIEKTAPLPYFFQFRGSVYDYHNLPHFLPYAGVYKVTMEVFDMFNARSMKIKTQYITVYTREIEIGAFARWRDHAEYTWDSTDLTWDELSGSTWTFPIEGISIFNSPLHEKMIAWPRYRNQTDAQVLSPYTNSSEDLLTVVGESEDKNNPARRFGTINLTWENMDLPWDELSHSTWDMYDYHAEFLGGFRIYNPQIGDKIQIDDYPEFEFFDVSPSIAPLDLDEAVSQLKQSTNRGLQKFDYHVFQGPASPGFIVATGKFPGPDSWHFVNYVQGTSPGGIYGDPNTWIYPSWVDSQNPLQDLITRYPGMDPEILFLEAPQADLVNNNANNLTYWQNAGFIKTEPEFVTTTINAGSLHVGTQYTIANYSNGDNFINVGASSNANGVVFIATGTTPTNWQNGSTLSFSITNPDFPPPYNHRGHLPSWYGSGSFTNGDLRAFKNDFEVPLGVPVFLIHNHSEIPGKYDERWIITNELTGEKIIEVKHKFVIFNFIEESTYTVELYLKDSHNNESYIKRKGYIKASSLANFGKFKHPEGTIRDF